MNNSVNNSDQDPIEIEIQKQISIASAILNEFKINKIHLTRPVFFVPGWCDEPCSWWIGPYKGIPGIAQWINQIVDNSEQVTYVNFNNETAQCTSFLDFGQFLKNKIWAAIGKEQPFDLVGHSMGGLDIRAALTQGDPLLNCQNCITADTPHQGDNYGGVLKSLEKYAPDLIDKVDNIPIYQQNQAKNMDPNYAPIQTINNLSNRQLFLSRVNKFVQFKGTRDWLVMDSCFMDPTGLTIPKEKIHYLSAEGCEHVGIKGVTIDIRVILSILYILLDIPIPGSENQGNLPGGNDAPTNDSQTFIDLTEY